MAAYRISYISFTATLCDEQSHDIQITRQCSNVEWLGAIKLQQRYTLHTEICTNVCIEAHTGQRIQECSCIRGTTGSAFLDMLYAHFILSV